MKKNVYVFKDTGNSIITHWFLFTLSAFKHIPESSARPIYIHTRVTEQFQRETLELLKPDYEFVEDITNCNCITVEPVTLLQLVRIEDHYYPFVRNLILSRNPYLIEKNDPSRLIYISRNKSHELNCNRGAKRRQLSNDIEVQSAMKEIGFECIYLEDYTIPEKIKLYQQAKCIVTPSGGANTMALFAHPKTKIIEIIDPRSDEDQYLYIGKNLGNPFIRYTNVDSYDHFNRLTTPGLCKEYYMRVKDPNDLKLFISGLV